MKILITLIMCSFLGCAHTGDIPELVSYSEIGWAWIPGHEARGQRVKGHWFHPENGHYYRKKSQGPPHANWSPIICYPGSGWSWSPGHWEGMGLNRKWVDGQWIENEKGEE